MEERALGLEKLREQLQQAHRLDAIVLDAELERPEGAEVAVEDDLAQREVAHVREEVERAGGQLEQVITVRSASKAWRSTKSSLRAVLVQRLLEQRAAHAVIRELALHVLAEHHLLVAVRVQQLAREPDALVDGVAYVLQLLAEVAGHQRPRASTVMLCRLK